MLEDEQQDHSTSDTETATPAGGGQDPSKAAPRRRRSAGRAAGPPPALFSAAGDSAAPAADSTDPKPPTEPTRSAPAVTSAAAGSSPALFQPPPEVTEAAAKKAPAKKAPAKKAPAKKAPAKKATAKTPTAESSVPDEGAEQTEAPGASTDDATEVAAPRATSTRSRGGRGRGGKGAAKATTGGDEGQSAALDESGSAEQRGGQSVTSATATSATATDAVASGDAAGADTSAEGSGAAGSEGAAPGEGTSSSSRRRRRRRRRGGGGSGATGDANAEDGQDAQEADENTVVRARESRGRGGRGGGKDSGKTDHDGVTATKGSTRMEARKQRRRDNRDSGRRRAPILSESEFLARRESVQRRLVVRQGGDAEQPMTQIAVVEDDMLVEHYVDFGTQRSLIGNVYLGKVQNVLTAMEAAFIDIGRGRNAVLYAGEVDWRGLGMDGQPKRIEQALQPGQSVMVQVTKDPIGQKGARLTGHVSLPGRCLVYVPKGSMSGISRKLADAERTRLRAILKDIVPDDAEVIVRTAAEGVDEAELRRDVTRLSAQWEDIQTKAGTGSAPKLLYAEPDLTLKIIRDLFNEDFTELVVSGDDAWDTVQPYVAFIAPHLVDRLRRWEAPASGAAADEQASGDVFDEYRIREQITKGLDRKVYLPSGGSLVIDRTEAMTVVDVNTGKFTGSGGNLEETVTRNNLEAAEEIVRQLRLRDIGGIIVVDFIDMVLESNRELVLRRLVEGLSRDRTKHQVAEMTSLGLVQMTRKRIGTGLVETFSEPCDCCGGRGLHVRETPIPPPPKEDSPRTTKHRRGSGSGKPQGEGSRSGKSQRGKSQEDKPQDKPKEDKPPTTAEDEAPASQTGGEETV